MLGFGVLVRNCLLIGGGKVWKKPLFSVRLVPRCYVLGVVRDSRLTRMPARFCVAGSVGLCFLHVSGEL